MSCKCLKSINIYIHKLFELKLGILVSQTINLITFPMRNLPQDGLPKPWLDSFLMKNFTTGWTYICFDKYLSASHMLSSSCISWCWRSGIMFQPHVWLKVWTSDFPTTTQHCLSATIHSILQRYMFFNLYITSNLFNLVHEL